MSEKEKIEFREKLDKALKESFFKMIDLKKKLGQTPTITSTFHSDFWNHDIAPPGLRLQVSSMPRVPQSLHPGLPTTLAPPGLCGRGPLIFIIIGMTKT